jgi:glycosyltransferase involved in cell wall biosynthesis
MSLLVSILIPAYNAERWIAECLVSAIGQTWPHTEIIVVDDGSTDSTLAIASSFASETVSVVSQPHSGAATARNRALSLSHGDYMQWLDADDVLGPEKIERQLLLARRHTARTLLSSAWGSFIYRRSHSKFVPTALWQDQSPLEWLARKMEHNLHMQTATWLVSRELTDAAGPWNTDLSYDDDGEYFCRVLLHADQVRFAGDGNVFFRASNPGSLSTIGSSREKMSSAFRSARLHIAYLRSMEDSERTRAVCVTFLQTSLKIFHPDRPDLVNEARQLAGELGGSLEPPRLTWKYAWISTLFGELAARRAQIRLRLIRRAVTRWWDWTLFHLNPSSPSAPTR